MALTMESLLFRMTLQLMVVHHITKFGYKKLHTNTQPTGNKYLSGSITALTLEDPTVPSLL